jgi:hypothetical protein
MDVGSSYANSLRPFLTSSFAAVMVASSRLYPPKIASPALRVIANELFVSPAIEASTKGFGILISPIVKSKSICGKVQPLSSRV